MEEGKLSISRYPNKLDSLRDGITRINEGIKLLSGGSIGNAEFDYNLKWALNCVEGLFKRAPFKVDDRVVLTKAPNIGPTSGWSGSKHFLIKGAQGVIREVDFDNGKFYAMVEFDKESYISDYGETKGQIIPVKNKHVYGLSEDALMTLL